MINWTAMVLLMMFGGAVICVMQRDQKIKELRKENEELKKKIAGSYNTKK